MAKSSRASVVAALAPVWPTNPALPDAEAKTVALSKVEAWKRREEFPKEIVTSRVKRLRVTPLCTRALRCCLRQNQLRFGERGESKVIWRDRDYDLLIA